FGNRGASGIDGIVSSALGVAAASGGRGVALLGDLAFLHDAGGLALAGEAEVVFVLVDNDGGGIFEHLPVRAFDPPFTELFATPHGRELGALSAAFGVPHDVVEAAEVGAAIDRALSSGGTRVVEVKTDRALEVEARAADRARAVAAAKEALVAMRGPVAAMKEAVATDASGRTSTPRTGVDG
ncbi:MAG: thiamine pyrophosphate-binding protein, partial [Longimicrobiales bacterium]|nr:thiamine pyrophosphate-binding protein [Longimicrobiales bacterium]